MSQSPTFEKRNPADTRDLIGEFLNSSAVEVQNAVDAANRALPAWRALSGDARGAILFKAADLLAARKDEVAAALTREEGKSLPEATGETLRGVAILRYFAGEGLRPMGENIPSLSAQTMLFTQRVPLGVVGLITPWNFPIAIPLWKAAPALVFGNTVVLKPSEHSPVTAQLLTEILAEAGLPAGVWNLIQGGPQTGAALLEARGLNAVSFTGSAKTGKIVARAGAERGFKTQLEMGGKNPVVVLQDANLDKAVELTVQGAFKSAGEKCTATSRVILEEPIAGEFTRRLLERVAELQVGPGTDAQFYLGPLITAEARENVLKRVEEAQNDGAKVLCGGAIESEELAHGHYLSPFVLDEVKPEMTIAREEVFGPVLAILRVPNFERALEVANDVAYGLSASVFTRSLDKALLFARGVEAGMVRINGETAGVEPQAPFGGMKGSSSYSREQGQSARDFYTQIKTISIDLAD